MKQFVFEIDGGKFDDFSGLVSEFNRVFIVSLEETWNGNLDALADYLTWPGEPFTIHWRNSNKSRADLGHGATETWLRENLNHCHPSNTAAVKAKLCDAQNRIGDTLFDWLVEIFRDGAPNVELILT